jgi:type II secretory pathway pseudopilin PulG
MKKSKNAKRIFGATIPEVLVAVATFAVLAGMLASSLTLTVKWLHKADAEILSHHVCVNAMDIIVNELRQAVPNPDPRTGTSSTGYLRLTESGMEPVRTSVLMPNYRDGQKESTYILFTAPNFSKFDNIYDSSFNIEEPSNYKHVRFYVNEAKTQLIREVRFIDSAGSLGTPIPTTIAEVQDGEININFWCGDPKIYRVRLSVTEAKGKSAQRTYSAETTVQLLVD